MLLSHCPNCQHDNKPGERFCASCGVPLDLKPCSVCGKVDDVKATICTGCGTHFPPVVAGLYPNDASVAPKAAHGKPVPPLVPPPHSTMRPLPLIIVALAAGGIPMLWLYRNEMPVPKAWQPQRSASIDAPVFPPPPIGPIAAPAAKTEVAPAAQPAAPDPTSRPISPTLTPPPPATNPEVTGDAPPTTATVGEAPDTIVPPQEPAATAKTKVAAQPVAKPVVRSKSPGRNALPAAAPAAAAPASGSECTEALAAVGLCEPKAGR